MTRDELDAATDEQLNQTAAKVMGWVRRTHNDVMGTTNADLEDDDYWRAAKATTSAEQRAVEARAELEQLAQSPDGRRQIDMLAAERVMGWVRRTRADVYQERTDDPEVPDGEWYAALGNEWWARDGDKWKDVAYVEDEGCCREDYEQGWRPTTSIADAWQLVEKMRADDYDVQVTARRWTTTCYIEQYESIKAVITNDTAPLAITIAAIIAGGEAT